MNKFRYILFMLIANFYVIQTRKKKPTTATITTCVCSFALYTPIIGFTFFGTLNLTGQ